jgi:hypothetical protein
MKCLEVPGFSPQHNCCFHSTAHRHTLKECKERSGSWLTQQQLKKETLERKFEDRCTQPSAAAAKEAAEHNFNKRKPETKEMPIFTNIDIEKQFGCIGLR